MLYVPARDVLVSAPRDLNDDEIRAERISKLCRAGLVLDGDGVLNAMGHGENTFIRLRTSRGEGAGVALANAEQMGELSRHVHETLLEMARELRSGSIACDPYFRSQQDNACAKCDFYDVCHFTPGVGSDRHRVLQKITTENVWELMKGGDGHG